MTVKKQEGKSTEHSCKDQEEDQQQLKNYSMDEKKIKKLNSRVPKFLEPFVELDKNMSSWLAVCASQSSTLGDFRKHMKILEISCHGIPWLAGTAGGIFLFTNIETQQILVNMLIALLLDCLFVAVIKAAVRRGRPVENENDMFATISLDGYAFPSGHASRAVLLFCICLFKSHFLLLFVLFIGLWSIIVCVSRILLARHHVGDVLAGCVLGYFEFCLTDYLWVNEEGTKYILKMFEVEYDL